MPRDLSIVRFAMACKQGRSKAWKQADSAPTKSGNGSLAPSRDEVQGRLARLTARFQWLGPPANQQRAVRKICVQTESGFGVRSYPHDRVARIRGPRASVACGSGR